MNKIIYDVELLPIQYQESKHGYYDKYIKQIKNNKDKVKLCLYCAKYCFDFNNKFTILKAKKSIDLVEKCLINPKSVTKEELLDASNDSYIDPYHVIEEDFNFCYDAFYSLNIAVNVSYAAANISYSFYVGSYVSYCLYWCLQISNIRMDLIHQYLQILLRTTKQFNTDNSYSKHVKQIVKQDVDKLELVDYNMLLDISNEYYNIDLSEFNYDNIFSRRNLIELIRREYNHE